MPPPVQVAYKEVGKPEIGVNNYQGFMPGKTEVLPVGWNGYDAKPLTSPIRIDHDVEIVVRDGCRLYIDVYRPADIEGPLPAILSWSPYGKKYSGLAMLPVTTWHCCVKRTDLSGLEKFEGLDPAVWCPRGYAIVSVDARGAGHSDGDIVVMGSQEAEDGYDVVEGIAKLPWCDGNIGLAGNSYLGIMQWHIAQLNPPSLKAIAPWEACADIYREQFGRGGVFNMSNFDLISTLILKSEKGRVEDIAEMYRRMPLATAYWNDKRCNLKDIKVPAYITGSDFSSIHTMGSIRGFMELDTPHKWIRWSPWQEWYDLWCVPENDRELTQFFDKFLKKKDNGFEKTPRIRWTALKMGDRPATDGIVLDHFPPTSTEYRSLYIQGDRLVPQPPSSSSSEIATYNSEDRDDFASFTYTFSQDSRAIGFPKAHLFMSCPDLDDMNVFILLRKLDKDGVPLMHLCFPVTATPVSSIAEIPEKDQSSLNLHLGSIGVLRASHRAIDRAKSIHAQVPFHPHEVEEKIPRGQIVELEIGIWAMGVDFEKGESLRMQVGGSFPGFAEYSAFSNPRPDHERNKGTHRIHSGAQFPSRLILPLI